MNKTLFSALSLAALMLSIAADTTVPLTTALTTQLCGIVNGIKAIVGILALALFLIGGVIYAIAHFLPTSLDYRKSLVGWSTAMITGGIIGLIIVLLAPYIVSTINSLGGSANGGSSLSVIDCGASSGTSSSPPASSTCSSIGGVCSPINTCTSPSSCSSSSTSDCPAQNQQNVCCCLSAFRR